MLTIIACSRCDSLDGPVYNSWAVTYVIICCQKLRKMFEDRVVCTRLEAVQQPIVFLHEVQKHFMTYSSDVTKQLS